MTIVIKLGGCNGSGKSSVAKALLQSNSMRIIEHKKKKPYVYGVTHKGLQWAVLGSYENACGGMDTISDKHERLALVERYMKEKAIDVVFFEGLITGKTYGAFGDMSERQGHQWLYAFMDTPFDVCVARVLQRRKAAGNDAPFDPDRTMSPTFRSVESVARRAAEYGHKVIHLKHQLSPDLLANGLATTAFKMRKDAEVAGMAKVRP